MRINKATLLKIAIDTAKQRSRSDRNLLAIYLHGSVLGEDPILGGTADIDLVFVHSSGDFLPREIDRLTDEVHLDIAHHDYKEYRKPRALRVHPWMGPTIYGCRILYDPQHFMDFTQASVRGQFNRPDYVLARARNLFEHARQMWFSLNDLDSEPGLEHLRLYLRAVEHIANTVASLSGSPLTERRFLMQFADRAKAVNRSGLYAGLLGLLGAPKVDAAGVRAWLPDWQSAYDSMPTGEVPPRLQPARKLYYQRAFEKILVGDKPHDVLWPLLRTWTSAVEIFPQETDVHQAWSESMRTLDLLGQGFSERVAALDAFLDTVEEILDDWGRTSGAEYRPGLAL